MWRVIRILSIQFILSNLILNTTEDAEDWRLGLLPACAKPEPPALSIILGAVLRPRILIATPKEHPNICRYYLGLSLSFVGKPIYGLAT